MNVESSTPRSVGRPRRGAAEAPSTAVRRGGDCARRGGMGRVGLVRGRATGSRSRCDGGGARGVVPRVAAARSRQYVGEGRLTGVEAGLRYATGPAPLDAWRRAAEPMTACRYFWPGVRAAAGASSDPLESEAAAPVHWRSGEGKPETW